MEYCNLKKKLETKDLWRDNLMNDINNLVINDDSNSFVIGKEIHLIDFGYDENCSFYTSYTLYFHIY